MNPEIRINCGSPMYFDYGADEPYKVQNYGNQSYGTITLARADRVLVQHRLRAGGQRLWACRT